MKKLTPANKVELAILFIILLVAAFCRLYKIDQYMMFLGDEGRDVMVVRRFLVYGDLMFVGPGTSVGNMYLGPLYYYLMAPALLIANYSPVGPAVMVALFGVATVFLVWLAAMKWFGGPGAWIATALYALSPVVIFYSRSSWNPNIMPFFALLTVYALWWLWEKANWRWLFVAGLSFTFVTQSHYLGLFLVPLIILFWLKTYLKSKIDAGKKRQVAVYTLVTGVCFTFLSLPLVLFDARYHWRNFKAINAFLFAKSGDFAFRIDKFIPKIWVVWEKLNTRLLAGTNEIAGRILAIGLAVIGLVILYQKLRSKGYRLSALSCLLVSWLGVGVLGLALYKSEIYDHYFGFMFPAPFLLLAFLLNYFERNLKLKGRRYVFYLGCFLLLLLSLAKNPLLKAPNRLLQRSMIVAEKIKEEAGGKKYNFALIADKNYEPAYQYFLELWGTNISEIDPQKYEATVADQLFVVCEYPKELCQPTSNPKAGIANFGWSKVESSWEVYGVLIFKLVHNI